ncbi:beta-ketoacyl-ACP synthase [Cellvibrio sp. QJXJ]|uniref:beta-ketoacyl-ACP synthase n=1 Tax=Cellvibrio sp. QJXJ TaxID=2964606 RepID=UPI0021C333CA|nr:beta-ketoacyl-ACP synthase [Cellvibrio sp. QJXJ]UUA72051.1 beta-ketoacyl-ACP synthase [Cellvibrio sp. QJXJ]
MTKRVAITGAGAISALGHEWKTIRANILQLKNRVRYMHEWDQYPELQTRLASPVDDFILPAHYTQKKKRGMGRVAQMAVAATEQALIHAGLFKDPLISSDATGVAYGSATGSSDAAMEFFGLLEHKSMAKLNGTTYLRMMSHSAAVNISVLFGTCGRMYTTSSACTAGSQGIGFAYEAIRSGQQTIMIAGGAEELCPTQAAVFDTVYSASLKNATPELSPRAFDPQRDGLVLGEGACTLILEDWDHAVARGANILAEIVGFATNCDGNHLVRPNQATMAKVLQKSLQDAQLNAEQIHYISGHGTATVHGDIAESLATQQVMGSHIPFSSLKSYIGHSLGACGSLEAWLGIEMMNENWFSPNLNLDDVDENCGQLDYIRNEVRELQAQYFMSNNFAFGGVNTSLIFKRV